VFFNKLLVPTRPTGIRYQVRHGMKPVAGTSGGTVRRLGISKRGDPYLQTLLIHGARSVMYRAGQKTDQRSLWIADKELRLGTSKACMAVASKNAQILWSPIARSAA
jgi:transposase